MTVSILTICIGLTACSNPMGDKPRTDKITTDSSLPESLILMRKDALTNIYTQAIAEFIKAAYKKDKTTFDTLYFGKHVYGQPEDFPDIELPETIEKTQIRLVSPEVGQKKQTERKSLVYVNMMGWIDKELAEFLLVVFSNGAEHQYDYHLKFTHNAKTNKYELAEIAFENYVHLNGQKPNRITLYKDGNDVGEKSSDRPEWRTSD